MKNLGLAAARLAILLLTCGAVFWLGSRFLLRGQEVANARAEQGWHALQNKANEGRAALKSLPLFREEVGRLELEADKLLSAAPAGASGTSGISELLSHLGRIGTASGVTLQQFGDDESETAAQVTVRGSRRQLLAFFTALRDDGYPFIADDLELFLVEGMTGVLQADLAVSSPPEQPSQP